MSHPPADCAALEVRLVALEADAAADCVSAAISRARLDALLSRYDVVVRVRSGLPQLVAADRCQIAAVNEKLALWSDTLARLECGVEIVKHLS